MFSSPSKRLVFSSPHRLPRLVRRLRDACSVPVASGRSDLLTRFRHPRNSNRRSFASENSKDNWKTKGRDMYSRPLVETPAKDRRWTRRCATGRLPSAQNEGVARLEDATPRVGRPLETATRIAVCARFGPLAQSQTLCHQRAGPSSRGSSVTPGRAPGASRLRNSTQGSRDTDRLIRFARSASTVT